MSLGNEFENGGWLWGTFWGMGNVLGNGFGEWGMTLGDGECFGEWGMVSRE